MLATNFIIDSLCCATRRRLIIKKKNFSWARSEHTRSLSCTDASRVRRLIDRAEQKKKKRAQVEERYMAEEEKSLQPKSSKVWEHFTLNKQKKCVNCKICKSDGMTREHHGNDPAPETQTCWSLWWGGREFNSRVSHYRILLLFRFEVRNVMSLVLVFTRYPAWQAWQVSVSSLITVVKQGWYSYFALCIARLKTRFYSLAFFGPFIFQSVVMYSYTAKKAFLT